VALVSARAERGTRPARLLGEGAEPNRGDGRVGRGLGEGVDGTKGNAEPEEFWPREGKGKENGKERNWAYRGVLFHAAHLLRVHLR
jgi:hypothetical protein